MLNLLGRRRVTPTRLLLVLAVLTTSLLAAACADRSEAQPATAGVEVWRFWFGVACGVLVVLWVALLGLIGAGLGPTSTDAFGNLVTGLLTAALSCVLTFTVAGQFTNWLTASIYGWGTLGTVTLVLLSALGATQGMKGIPIAYVSLFGFAYPDEALLFLMVVPALVVQLPAAAWVAWAEIAARQRQ